MGLTSWLLLTVVGLANGLADTDTITWGGDNSRAGYQTNHNMDPAVVRSSQFDRIFQTQFPGAYGGSSEQVFSQPLVYTPSGDDTQYVYVATTQNNVYKLDAQTGEILASRNLHIPFLVEDLNGCTDINPHIGVTGTGVIDPDTDTYYFLAKTYEDQTQINVAQGRPAGRYYLHALDVNDLSERPNFPVDLEGTISRNNPTRMFNGGDHLQRPGLLHVGQWIYAGLGSHCVHYNFTGWVMGWDKTTGEQIERFSTQGEGVPNDVEGAGIWMSGGGLAYDGAGSIFYATGNGYASQLAEVPVNGRDPPTALEQAAVHMTIQDDGTLDVVDFFMPEEKRELDGADMDLGTSPLQILPSEFSCGNVQRIGVVTGKSGKTYWLNLDDLGGYRNGGVGLDNVLQIYQHENSVYAGAGVYPLEGGYIYINVIRYPTVVFRFACNNGVPAFNRVAVTPEANAYTLGVSHGTVTSLDGQPGTGLLWTTDVQNPPGQLRVYNAVPRDGELELIKSWEVPGVTKFTRAVFGDGILYFGSTNGQFHGFGAPVNAPINCTSPVDFGTVDLESSSDGTTVTCRALIDVVIGNLTLRDGTDFAVSDLPSLPLTLGEGATFSFSATFAPTEIGLLSTDVNIESENSQEGFRTTTSVRLTGQGESESPRLSVSPRSVTFDNVITGNSSVAPNNVVLSNQGNSELTISEILYSDTINGTFSSFDPDDETLVIGPFTVRNLPTTIDANSGATLSVSFDPSSSGNFSGHVRIVSDGGSAEFTISGWSGPAPVAFVEFQTIDGSGWVPYENGQNFTFGNVTENTSRSLRMRVTNTAPQGGVRLSLTVSKPPFGGGSIIRANNQVDLGEGTSIAPGDSQSAVLYCSVPKRQWNMEPYDAYASWSMNTNDPNFEYHIFGFACQAVSQQAPPLLSDGLGQYRYVGCFLENNPGRQLATQLYGDDNNTIPMCINACHEADQIFCGTQYRRECWAGPTIPRQRVADGNCNFDCTGDLNQVCGGNGVGDLSGETFISLFADTLRFDGNETNIPEEPSAPVGPIVNPGVGGYVSIGCFTEAPEGRALPYFHATEEQTVAMCVDACSENDYTYAGLQYGGECWCGDHFTAGSEITGLDECNMACNGNGTEYCGGPSRLNVYQHTSGAPPTTSGSGNTTTTTASSLPSIPSTTSSGNLTATSSGTAITSDATTSATTITTTSASSTPTPEKIESIGNWIFQGCYTEGDGVRALSDSTFADDDMTLDACAEFCEGSEYFGTEYGRECYCGNTLNGGSSLAENQDDCYFPCAGDGTQFCGAGNRLELYRYGSISSTLPSVTASSTDHSSGATASSSTLEASTSSILSSVTSEAAESSSLVATTSSLLSSDAVSASSSSGLLSTTTSPAVESASSSSLASISVVASSSSEIISSAVSSSSSSSFSSSSSVISSASSVSSTVSSASTSAIPSSSAASSSSTSTSSTSSTSTSSATSTPTPEVYPGNEEWVYSGCYSEPEPGRLLPRQILNDGDNMTIPLCLSECEDFNYAGVEYGRECWCGDVLNLAGDVPSEGEARPGELVDDEDCSFLCPGNSTQFCGAGVRMSVYWLRELAEEEEDAA